MKLKIILTPEERTTIVFALMNVNEQELARDFNARALDTADDGPEVSILSVDKEHHD